MIQCFSKWVIGSFATNKGRCKMLLRQTGDNTSKAHWVQIVSQAEERTPGIMGH